MAYSRTRYYAPRAAAIGAAIAINSILFFTHTLIEIIVALVLVITGATVGSLWDERHFQRVRRETREAEKDKISLGYSQQDKFN